MRIVSRLVVAVLVASMAFLVAGCGGGSKPRPDLLFVSTRDGVYAIYAMDADGSRQQRFSTDPLPKKTTAPSALLYEVDPAWSPDGRQVAFASDRSGRYEVYVTPAAGGPARRLTSETGGATQPAWSPDGKKIAFVRFQPGALYVVPVAGGAAQRLSDDQGDQSYPTWSTDGKQIAFVRRTPGTSVKEIWVMNADGTGTRQVTHLEASIISPSWAPSGTRLAFSSNARGQYEIYAIDLDGKGLHRLTEGTADDTGSAWSPDAKLIAFSRDGSIDTVDFAGKVTQLTDAKNNDSSPAWKPLDGK